MRTLYEITVKISVIAESLEEAKSLIDNDLDFAMMSNDDSTMQNYYITNEHDFRVLSYDIEEE